MLDTLSQARQEDELLKNGKLFEERLCELVRCFKHLYDISSPGHRDKQSPQKNCEEI